MSEQPKCCGYFCHTLFCPHCGNKVNAHDLASLLLHIRARIKTSKATTNPSTWKTTSLQKWQAWERAIVSAIERQATTSEGE